MRIHLELRRARVARGWTQTQLAERLGVSQSYVSHIEHNRRALPSHLVAQLVPTLKLPVTSLPVRDGAALAHGHARRVLAALGYPAFARHSGVSLLNPAVLLLRTARNSPVDVSLLNGLVWLVLSHPVLDWEWLTTRAKLHDVQNRLGFVVALAIRVAMQTDNGQTAATLRRWEARLYASRLAKAEQFVRVKDACAERRLARLAEAQRWHIRGEYRTRRRSSHRATEGQR